MSSELPPTLVPGADFFEALNKELHSFLHHASPVAAAAGGKKGAGLSYVLLMTHTSDLYGACLLLVFAARLRLTWAARCSPSRGAP
jgi:hypothetical protein